LFSTIFEHQLIYYLSQANATFFQMIKNFLTEVLANDDVTLNYVFGFLPYYIKSNHKVDFYCKFAGTRQCKYLKTHTCFTLKRPKATYLPINCHLNLN